MQSSPPGGDRKPLLVVVDGNSLLYRAFFALPALTTATGIPTNAVYGYTAMLLRLLEEERPDVILIAQEGGRTFRHEQYAAYKAQRPKAPPDLVTQSALARQVAEVLRIPQVRAPGFEADDLVGTLACRGKAEGWQVLLVTGDLDALQLVDNDVRVMITRRGTTDTMVYDREAVRARFQLDPEQLPDFKALKGDPSDNIPGVPGIGDKTASRLIGEHGTLERLLEAAPDLPAGKARDALLAEGPKALQYKALCTIVTDVPVETPLDSWRYEGPEPDAAEELFQQLEFRTLARKLPALRRGAKAVPRPEAVPEVPCRENPDAAEVAGFAERARAAGRLALRTQPAQVSKRASLPAASAVSTGTESLCFGPDAPVPGDDSLLAAAEAPHSASVPDVIRALLESDGVATAAHDLKAEMHRLGAKGLAIGRPAFDSLLAAYVLNPGRSSYRLEDLAAEYVGLAIPEAAPPRARVGQEAAAVARLWEPMEERLAAEELERVYRELELPLVPILREMEAAGVLVDPERLGELGERLGERVEALQAEIFGLAGHEFNIGSPKQLQVVLFEELGLQSGKRTRTGLASTSVDVLEELAGEHEIIRKILEFREVAKLKSTYADALQTLRDPRSGRVHTTLNQTVAATGRLSSSEPNLQNIPIRSEIGREIRSAFVAPAGWQLVSADYSQIELRILAHVTRDPEMVRAFQEEEDVHTTTAARVFNVPAAEVTPELRRRGKTLNFAVIYGMSDFGLSRSLQIPVAQAHDLIEAYFQRFPGVRRYTEETIRQARRDGFVKTLPPYGRKRFFPGLHAGNRSERQNAERAAVNAPIQGTAADIIKAAMIAVHRELRARRLRSRMLLQVHDELLFEALPEEQSELVELVRREMAAAGQHLSVPLRVDVKAGCNWRDMEAVGS